MERKSIDTIWNTHLHNREGLWILRLHKGRIAEILPQKDDIILDGSAIDAQKGLTLPAFVEPHIHLDTTQTAGNPQWNLSGTLFEGIKIWTERKKHLDYHDIEERAIRTIRWQIEQGIQYIRTHVDVCDPELKALKALLEIKQKVASLVQIQIVAFPQEGILSFPKGKELLEEAIILGADCIGAIPHFEFTREYGIQSLHTVFQLAHKYDRMVDIHCDETDDDQSRFLETLATLAYEYTIGHRVTASHTTAMHSYNAAYTSKLFRLLQLSNINFVANPLVNIHLQGRFDHYPKRRGITRVKELLDHGVNVCFGHDDIMDPWYPLGNGNMLQVLHMGLHLCHMTGYDCIRESLDLITTRSAQTLQLTDYGMEKHCHANLIILPVPNAFEAIRQQASIHYAIRQGQIIVSHTPTRPSTFF